MRLGFIGFVLGAILVILATLVARQRVIDHVSDDLGFQFDSYVFSGPDFPGGDFEQGRLVRRLLFPASFTINFYDSHYHAVKKAERPGRYGAVVRMNISGQIIYRFVTLYRTAVPVSFVETPWPISNEFPGQWGIDAQVVKNQQSKIGDQLKTDSGSSATAIVLAALADTSPAEPLAVNRTAAVARDDAWWYGLRQKLHFEPRYRYLTDLPRDYDSDSTKRWPLILYVPSGAEAGNDLHVVRRSGLAHVIDDGKQIPAIVVSPQCPFHEHWTANALLQLLDEVTAKYRVDLDRVYVTGGSGAWMLALADPQRFAAAIPIDGATDPADAARLRDLPIWAFHGVGDQPTRLAVTTDMLDAIRKAGGHPHLTVSKKLGDVWDQVYPMDSPYSWLLDQKKGQPDRTAAPTLDAESWRLDW